MDQVNTTKPFRSTTENPENHGLSQTVDVNQNTSPSNIAQNTQQTDHLINLTGKSIFILLIWALFIGLFGFLGTSGGNGRADIYIYGAPFAITYFLVKYF